MKDVTSLTLLALKREISAGRRTIPQVVKQKGVNYQLEGIGGLIMGGALCMHV